MSPDVDHPRRKSLGKKPPKKFSFDRGRRRRRHGRQRGRKGAVAIKNREEKAGGGGDNGEIQWRMPEGRRGSSGTGDKKKSWRARSDGGDERERGRWAVLMNEDGSSIGMRKRHGRMVAETKLEEIRSWDGGASLLADKGIGGREEEVGGGELLGMADGGGKQKRTDAAMRGEEEAVGDSGFWQGKK